MKNLTRKEIAILVLVLIITVIMSFSIGLKVGSHKKQGMQMGDRQQFQGMQNRERVNSERSSQGMSDQGNRQFPRGEILENMSTEQVEVSVQISE